MLKLVTILLCLGTALSTPADIYNGLVDEFLYMASQFMVEYKLDTLKLPESNIAFDHKKLASWDSVTGTIKTGPGTVVNATGIHRNGDASIELVGEDTMVIKLGIYTDPLIITFMNFNIDFSSPWPFSNDGGMQLKVDKNEVDIQITFKKATGECSLTFDKAEITTLGYIDFLILPDTWWAEVKDKGIDLYIKAHNDDLKIILNMYLQGILQDVVNKVNPCSYVPF